MTSSPADEPDRRRPYRPGRYVARARVPQDAWCVLVVKLDPRRRPAALTRDDESDVLRSRVVAALEADDRIRGRASTSAPGVIEVTTCTPDYHEAYLLADDLLTRVRALDLRREDGSLVTASIGAAQGHARNLPDLRMAALRHCADALRTGGDQVRWRPWTPDDDGPMRGGDGSAGLPARPGAPPGAGALSAQAPLPAEDRPS